ncbi:hypothetical protein [Paenibacillus xylanexedens]|uniref:hypothetical protein n=1 Tax=Paenibacillus xylanexedens TaxID=528191 RepID=UPI0011A57842|nr:hypothetical protein [Paenibacillus xylanexedens]
MDSKTILPSLIIRLPLRSIVRIPAIIGSWTVDGEGLRVPDRARLYRASASGIQVPGQISGLDRRYQTFHLVLRRERLFEPATQHIYSMKKQAKDYVMRNLKQMSRNWRALIQKLQTFQQNTGLFCRASRDETL